VIKIRISTDIKHIIKRVRSSRIFIDGLITGFGSFTLSGGTGKGLISIILYICTCSLPNLP
jgi:hypothetical protein